MTSIKEQLNVLVELQDTELEIRHLEKELAGIEARVEAMLEQLREYEQRVEESVALLEEIKKSYRDDESEIHMIDSQVVKSNEKLSAVKTNKEYQSTLKEIDDLKEKSSQIEDGMLEKLDRIETVEKDLALQRSDLEDVQQEVAGKQEDIRAQGKAQEAALEQLLQQRDAIIETVDEKLLSFYQKVKQQNGGIAMVAVIDTVCHQCRMNIPPQLFNELMRMNSMMMCPHCQRIMYPKEVLFD